eukprot:scaffold437298_cov45-Prasinocladus_malaysianus.AAC.2
MQLPEYAHRGRPYQVRLRPCLTQGCLAEDTICAEMAYMFNERNKVKTSQTYRLSISPSAGPQAWVLPVFESILIDY